MTAYKNRKEYYLFRINAEAQDTLKGREEAKMGRDNFYA